MMLREWAGLVRRVVVVIDGAVLVVSLLLACAARSAALGSGGFTTLVEGHLWLLWVILPTWIVLLRWVGLYESTRYRSYLAVARDVAIAHTLAGLTLLSVLFLGHAWAASRLVIQLFLVFAGGTLIAEKVGIRALQCWVRERGRNSRNVLVVGLNGLSSRYISNLEAHPFWGLRVIGCLSEKGRGNQPGSDESPEPEPNELPDADRRTVPVLGAVEDLRRILLSHPVDEVAFALPAASAESLALDLRTCLEKGVTARLVLEVPEIEINRRKFETLGGLPVVSFERTPSPGFGIVLKRLIDISGAIVGLIACGLVYLLYGPLIRRQSPGPVLFKQPRIGRNGRSFVLYKFRTMVDGAEAKRPDLAKDNEMEGPVFKIKDDPRITPLGKRMRARHLDEFPQFWSVLKGEMSLVGTRPPTPDEVARYDFRHHARLGWKPGLTGMWQVNGHVNRFEDIVRLDREYIDNWSLGLDLKIMAQTVRKVVRAEGA